MSVFEEHSSKPDTANVVLEQPRAVAKIQTSMRRLRIESSTRGFRQLQGHRRGLPVQAFVLVEILR
jgi:hypothetical protein